jgi:hypothetical protein
MTEAAARVVAEETAPRGRQPRRLDHGEIARFPRARPQQLAKRPTQDFELPVSPRARPPRDGFPDWDGESAVVPAKPSPLPVSGWLVDPALGSLDPQIAVSASHVIVTTTSLIAFYSRSGSLLKLLDAPSFFGPLKADINAHLNIPSNLVAKYSVDEFYDVRALYDRYRDRFWVGGLARNSGAKYGNAVDQTYRRTKFVLAVSDDADPFGAWTLWWWDAIADDGACNDPAHPPGTVTCPGSLFRPGYGADYPCIGISDSYFVEASWTNPCAMVNVIDAHDLVQGKFTHYRFFNFAYDDGQTVGGSLQPAIHHSSSAVMYLVSNKRDLETCSIWGIIPGKPPALVHKEFPITGYVPATTGKQKPLPPTISHPQIVNTGKNLNGGQILKAVCRDGQIYAVWTDCVQWGGAPQCMASIRLMRADVTKFPAKVTPTIQRTFGKKNVSDPPTALFSYAWPCLDVTKDGNMVLNYTRTGETIFPEARFSVYRANDADISPSQQFRQGTFPVGVDDPPQSLDPAGRLDNTGSAIDPTDDKTVWVIQAFAEKSNNTTGRYRLAVQKVKP